MLQKSMLPHPTLSPGGEGKGEGKKRRLNFGNSFIGDQTGKTKPKEKASKPPHQNHSEVLCKESEGSH
jgi:hypothetical protein